MTRSAQLEAVHKAAEVAEVQLGLIAVALELLGKDVATTFAPIGSTETDQWAVVLKWLAGTVLEEQARLYQALQHDAVEPERAER